jgi:hypothetical protein
VKVLIYGHSQAQPTGMGDDLVAALKKAKVEVKRLGLQGRNDKQLVEQSGQLGDTSGFDRVVLYCAGNNSKLNDTLGLIQHFGEKRVIVVMPPLNVDRVVAGKTLDQRREEWANYRNALSMVVPVVQLEGTKADFKKDEIHLKAGTAAGKAFAQTLSEYILGSAPASPPAAATAGGSSNVLLGGLGIIGLVGVVYWVLRR